MEDNQKTEQVTEQEIEQEIEKENNDPAEIEYE